MMQSDSVLQARPVWFDVWAQLGQVSTLIWFGILHWISENSWVCDFAMTARRLFYSDEFGIGANPFLFP